MSTKAIKKSVDHFYFHFRDNLHLEIIPAEKQPETEKLSLTQKVLK